MDFEFSQEQKMIQGMVRDFVKREVKPEIEEYEETESFPMPLVKKAAGLGLLGIIIPEKYGGAGADTISYCLMEEEIAKISAGLGLIMSANNSLSCTPILDHGTEEQKQKYLVPLAKGDKLGCWLLTEPGAGSDVAGIKSTARLEGNHWVLNGDKIFVTNGSVADICVGVFRTGPDRHKGLTAFIIESSSPGFEVTRVEKKMGLKCSLTAQLFFNNCRIPKENILGGEGQGFKIAMQTLNGGRVNIAAQSLGVAKGAFQEALAYAQNREQFGKKISEFQAIQFMLSEMAMEIEAAELMTYRAAWLIDRGLPFIKSASMAKAYASEMAERVASKALQIFGGSGYLKPTLVERFYRDARVLQVYEGTSQIQRMIIFKELLKT
ncbi:MAG: acyl-CoA dehydrogenase family protein [Candidatus Portnoybacteria bacterium]|nr:acyl-CoA dehydrogenase family protein [Candidatus Portnoybacteria bacterium]